ncbi:hypothetical protein T439DRAFT_331978 [Meredithblackwellia eburnea MCA 4105]
MAELPKVPKKRSRNGCLICRARKVRCGQEHPACEMCVRLHFQCQYAEPAPRRKSVPTTAITGNRGRSKNTAASVTSRGTSRDSVDGNNNNSPPGPIPSRIKDEDQEQFWNWLSGQAQGVSLEDNSAAASSSNSTGPAPPPIASTSSAILPPFEGPLGWAGAPTNPSPPYSFGLDVGMQPALEHHLIDGYTPPTPMATDQEILSHFIINTSAITKIRDSLAPNLYLGLFCEAMNNPILYISLLAFSTVHHAQWSGQPALLKKARDRQQEAHMTLLEALEKDRDVNKLIPAILMGASVRIFSSSLIVFCLLLTERFHQNMETQGLMHADCSAIQPVTTLIEHALKLLQNAPPFHTLPIVTQRSAYVIAAIDVRLQLFGLGPGNYTRYINALNDASASITQEPSNSNLSSILRVNLFVSRVAAFDLSTQLLLPETDLSGLVASANVLVGDLNRAGEMYDPPSLDPYSTMSLSAFVDIQDIDNDLFNSLFMAGLYHAACIYLFRVLERVPELAPLSKLRRTPHESALRILFMGMYVSKIRDTSQAVWPRPFFFAALELKDPVHLYVVHNYM